MAAGNSRREQDALSDFDVRDVCADFCYFAGNVAAQNARQRNLDPGHSRTHEQIQVIQRARAHANQDIVHIGRANLRLRNFGVAQHFRPAVFGKDYSLHWHLDDSTVRLSRRGSLGVKL